ARARAGEAADRAIRDARAARDRARRRRRRGPRRADPRSRARADLRRGVGQQGRGLSYARGMADKRALRDAVTRSVIDGPATATAEVRKAAAANAGLDGARKAFVDKVTRTAYKVTDEDI